MSSFLRAILLCVSVCIKILNIFEYYLSIKQQQYYSEIPTD